MFRDYEQFGNKKVVKTMSIGKRYKEHEKNFKKMINKSTPDDIDFTEQADAPIMDMGNMLSMTMEIMLRRRLIGLLTLRCLNFMG